MLLCKNHVYGTKPIWKQSFISHIKTRHEFPCDRQKIFASLTKVPISVGIQQVPDIGEIL